MSRAKDQLAEPADISRRWRDGLTALAAADPDLARILDETGEPELVQRAPGFPTLLRAIVAQQVSAAAARSIWTRVEAAVVPLTAEAFAALDDATIRSFGFSRQKILYARGLAEEIASGRLDMTALTALADEDAMSRLIALKGIGRWSAEIYLLFALGRFDVWPAGDLALAVAAQRIKRLDARPTPKQMIGVAEPWRPWRGIAALLLWHYYRNMP